jgi:hypothetical protein
MSDIDSAAVAPAAPPAPRTRRLRLVRVISALLTVISVVALGLMTWGGTGTVTKHTTVIKRVAATAKSSPLPASKEPTTSAPASATSPSGLIDPTPLTSTALGAPTDPPIATAANVTAPSAGTATTTTPTAPTPAGSAAPTPALPACPFPLPTPAQTGGLESLISLSPLFGPFSAEAFASAAAFQPVLELFGPFLVEFASLYATAEPSLAPLVSQLEALENDGFALISPYYLTYRTQFLTAETTLASALAPFAQTLVSNPAASCLVDVEGILTSAGGH